MSLQDIEKELYGQKARVIHPNKEEQQVEKELPLPQNPWRKEGVEWTAETPVKKVEKIGPRLLGGLVVVLLILVGLAGYYLYQYFTTKDARFRIDAPREVRIGEPFTLQVLFENVSEKVLYDPMFLIQLPEEAVYLEDLSRRIIEQVEDDLKPGTSVRRDFKVMLTKSSYQANRFNAEASFRYGNSTLSSRFQKNADSSVIAKDPVLSLDVSVPQSVAQGQDFELEVRYKNETNVALEDVIIRLDVPKGFSLHNSDPKLENGNEVRIEALDPYQEGIIILSGSLFTDPNAFVSFGARAIRKFGEKEFELASKNNSIYMRASVLEVRVVRTDKGGEIVYPQDEVRYSFQIQNNSSVPLEEVVAKVVFDGKHFNTATVQGNGSLNDADRSYAWNASRVGALARLDPGQRVEIPFSVALFGGYTPQGAPVKNAELKIHATAESATIPPELTAQKTIGTYTYTLKLGGKVSLQQLLFFAEPNTEIQNTGPMPPQVGKETLFTIHWKLNAVGTNMEQVRMRVPLGKGMRWTGKVSVQNIKEVPQYNPQTGIVSWDIDVLDVTRSAPEAIFQIGFLPALNMVGRDYIFLEELSLEAKDEFTGTEYSLTENPIDSRDFADANALQLGYDKIRP